MAMLMEKKKMTTRNNAQCSNPTPGSIAYFTVEMAQRGGETLLNSLFELKHKGAVAMAYQAFEGVCRAFIAHGEDTDVAEKRNTHQEHHSLWRARVHALNILKLICQDGMLAEDVACYVVDMFELAVRGFDCGSWAVRNSSMMLFAAATQRAIGDKRIADGGTHQQVSSDDVFSRFQQLRSFLARELSKLLANDKKPSALGGAAPPGLYPLLLFLSRLRPGDEDDQRVADAPASPCDDGNGLASFVPLVMKCASQPTMAIRHMAAKVVASIVSDADAATVLSMLCAKLPQGVQNQKDQPVQSKGLSHNYVHGVLAQIRHLTTKFLAIGGNRKKSIPISKNAQAELFEVVVTKFLPSTMWLWVTPSSESINAAIRAELVATVDVVTKFYAADDSHALSLLKSDSSKEEFSQTVQKIQAEVKRQLLQRCDSDRSNAVLLSTRPGIGEQLHVLVKRMLVSNVLQIRKKAIKKFANKLVVANLSSDSVAELQTILIGQFLAETLPKVRARQLQLLVLAPALELLALVAYHHQLTSPPSEMYTLYQTLGKEIELRSDENQPLILRQAAASTLHHSGLLYLHTKHDSLNASLALTAWTSALRLLQDDDVRVRAVARHAVQEALAKTVDSTVASSGGSLSDATVLPLAVEYITSSFTRMKNGADSLSKVLFELIDAPSVLTAYSGVAGVKAQDWDNLYRRIFESESSNYFAERDVLAQNIVHSLLARSIEDSESLRLLRKRVLTAVSSSLTTLNQEARRSDAEGGQWLGGITYYTDVFAPLFGLFAAGVAIMTSTSCPLTTELQSVASQVRELAQEACEIHSNDDATHPLLFRALELLAGNDQGTSKQPHTEPVQELLYLTPHWKALSDSRTA
ncbi:THADA protein [Phytophthora palmivora]|uniref:THADA protein n=1 Tax=Phytophthora palmivora TaxID=4796 RepID=A0A2P4XNS5_9STRA|nr:THADA protein [Phytophthora palmivora]